MLKKILNAAMCWMLWCLFMGVLNVSSYVTGDSHSMVNLVVGCLCLFCSGYWLKEWMVVK